VPSDGTTPQDNAQDAATRRRTRTRAFDFRRPNKLSRDHLRNLQIIHETFSGQFSTLLSSSLRSVCAMSVSSIEELTYDEYVRDMPIPTHLSVLSLDPLPGVGIYQLPIDAAMVIVDLLLGGQGNSPDIQRPLTDIETSLIRSVTDRALNELAYAFESVAEIQPAVVGVESNPQFAQLAAPSDMVIVINLTLQIGEVCETNLSLCYPYSTLKPILLEMVTANTAAGGDPDVIAAREKVASRLADVDVELSVTFEPVTVRSRDILMLRPGDVLTLGHPAEESLNAVVDGVPLFAVRPALKGKRLAAQVTSPIRTHPAG
jgi:flagellar motor switch protein FliM